MHSIPGCFPGSSQDTRHSCPLPKRQNFHNMLQFKSRPGRTTFSIDSTAELIGGSTHVSTRGKTPYYIGLSMTRSSPSPGCMTATGRVTGSRHRPSRSSPQIRMRWSHLFMIRCLPSSRWRMRKSGYGPQSSILIRCRR